MLTVIKKILLQLIDDIDAGNSNLSENECVQIIDTLKMMALFAPQGFRDSNPYPVLDSLRGAKDLLKAIMRIIFHR